MGDQAVGRGEILAQLLFGRHPRRIGWQGKGLRRHDVSSSGVRRGATGAIAATFADLNRAPGRLLAQMRQA